MPSDVLKTLLEKDIKDLTKEEAGAAKEYVKEYGEKTHALDMEYGLTRTAELRFGKNGITPAIVVAPFDPALVEKDAKGSESDSKEE